MKRPLSKKAPSRPGSPGSTAAPAVSSTTAKWACSCPGRRRKVTRSLDRALYLPREWTDDPERCRAAGIPEEVTFATKPELARRLVERALEAGARPAWVVADSVYGADSKLRFFLEERQQPYVMAVTSAQSVWTGLTQRRVKSLVALAPADAWQRLKVGAGTKGPRLFDWAAVAINHPYEPRSWQRWVLLRRSCSEPEDITFYLAFGPAGTALPALARAAGRRSRH